MLYHWVTHLATQQSIFGVAKRAVEGGCAANTPEVTE